MINMFFLIGFAFVILGLVLLFKKKLPGKIENKLKKEEDKENWIKNVGYMHILWGTIFINIYIMNIGLISIVIGWISNLMLIITSFILMNKTMKIHNRKEGR